MHDRKYRSPSLLKLLFRKDIWRNLYFLLKQGYIYRKMGKKILTNSIKWKECEHVHQNKSLVLVVEGPSTSKGVKK